MKQHDETRQGSFSSGGQRIDDHRSWMGARGKDSVFPDGPHKTKSETSAGGAGSLPVYEDTTEAIRRTQEAGQRKMHSHKSKPEYRN